jgi:hypothetical protein
VTTNQNRLAQHGPVQVAPDGTHFEHADHTPFLWLGDAAWEARPVPSPRAVGRQAKRRAAEKFTAVQWALASGKDAEGLAKFKRGSPATINLDFCRALDAKIATLNSAGLLAVLAPLWEIGVAPGSVLPEEQAIALGRYAVARWGAQHVAWVVALEGQSLGARVSRWQRLGRAVFGAAAHGPVLLWPGDALWLLDEFRGEPWVDALGYQTQQVVNDDGLQWLFAGPLNVEWQKAPVRPLLNLAPPARPGASLGPDAARRLLWWSLLLGPVAGTSCRAAAATTNDLWAVARLSDLMASIEFWRLQPAPRAVVGQPGWLVPRRHIAAAATPERDLLVVYTPEDRAVELALAALPPAPEANWFDPRTGEKFPARYAVSGQTARLVTPAAGDWVLVMRAGG